METKCILERILDDQGLTVKEFAEKIGYPAKKLYDIKQGRTKRFSDELLQIISDRFPNYSRVWLMTGMGDITVTHPSAPVFNNHGDNVQNEQNVISKEIIDMLRAKDAQIDRAMDQTDRLIANLEKSISSIEVLVQHITNGSK